MIRTLLSCLLLASTASAIAQPYAIGTTTRTWYDAVRMRDVPAELHYPAATEGDDQPSAVGAFPVLVVGHGFVMTVDAYEYIWQHFVPLGYIVALPITEGGFAPDHAAFGEDLAFCVQQLQVENADAVSLFFGHVDAATALMGHSMGGGAAMLGAVGNMSIAALVDLAPAETNPSAIAAATGVLVPTLLFAASEDCVTPIGTNQQPMFDALVPCKALVNITGGGHCYFGDDNFLCNFGEFTCGPALTITREQQHDVVTDLATLWLDHYLRNDASALMAFEDSMSVTTSAVTQYICLSTGQAENSVPAIRVWPSPASGVLYVDGLPPNSKLHFVDALGREQLVPRGTNALKDLDISALAEGTYHLVVRTTDGVQVHSFMVVH